MEAAQETVNHDEAQDGSLKTNIKLAVVSPVYVLADIRPTDKLVDISP